jgi:hypothetical protein
VGVSLRDQAVVLKRMIATRSGADAALFSDFLAQALLCLFGPMVIEVSQ